MIDKDFWNDLDFEKDLNVGECVPVRPHGSHSLKGVVKRVYNIIYYYISRISFHKI